MNDQRKVIFEQRLDLLQKSDVSETINEMRHELILDIKKKSIDIASYNNKKVNAEIKLK